MHTTIPLIMAVLSRPGSGIEAIAFPDEGAQKRFGSLFHQYDVVTCGKKRVGKERIVMIQDGDCQGKHVLIVDDMVKTGGTLVECAKALVAHGATGASAFCAHAAFPPSAERLFCVGGDRHVFRCAARARRTHRQPYPARDAAGWPLPQPRPHSHRTAASGRRARPRARADALPLPLPCVASSG
jgi:hypothetical protein